MTLLRTAFNSVFVNEFLLLAVIVIYAPFVPNRRPRPVMPRSRS